MSLARAAAVADKALDAERKGFHCVSGSLAITTSRDGDWTFQYGSPKARCAG